MSSEPKRGVDGQCRLPSVKEEKRRVPGCLVHQRIVGKDDVLEKLVRVSMVSGNILLVIVARIRLNLSQRQLVCGSYAGVRDSLALVKRNLCFYHFGSEMLSSVHDGSFRCPVPEDHRAHEDLCSAGRCCLSCFHRFHLFGVVVDHHLDVLVSTLGLRQRAHEVHSDLVEWTQH